MNRRLCKKIFCLLGCLFSTLICLSQNLDWKFSINATPAISWGPASGDIKSEGARFSFELSAYAEKYFRERYAYFAGISFINMSGQLSNISTSNISLKSGNLSLGVQETAKYSIQYLTIPVGIKLKTPQYGVFSYYFQGGLLPGVRLGSSVGIGESKRSLAKDLNLMTCAVQLSLGFLYPINEETFIKTGVIFNRFFVDAFSASNMKVLPTSIGLQIGFMF
ncbi:MAG: hypothetical protein LBT50_07550 [Prevotellaceae bacterium]|nr:hypothetical protein [Prevotellaceae bacterium]